MEKLHFFHLQVYNQVPITKFTLNSIKERFKNSVKNDHKLRHRPKKKKIKHETE
uniref:Uncharacterized protein n=1 Tax=Rhizophora mucronata TaxID=61149 RepID=A0A2P2QUA7_RHIMU